MSGHLEWALFVGAAYLVLSVFTLLVYVFDKHRARQQGQRIPERDLHLLALLGGWPGAWLAQRWIRHKNRKQSFMRRFYFTVVLHCTLVFVGAVPQARDWLWQQLQPLLPFVH